MMKDKALTWKAQITSAANGGEGYSLS